MNMSSPIKVCLEAVRAWKYELRCKYFETVLEISEPLAGEMCEEMMAKEPAASNFLNLMSMLEKLQFFPPSSDYLSTSWIDKYCVFYTYHIDSPNCWIKIAIDYSGDYPETPYSASAKHIFGTKPNPNEIPIPDFIMDPETLKSLDSIKEYLEENIKEQRE